MRKSLLTLLTVLFTLSSAYAADIVEDWTSKTVWTPTAAPTSNGAGTNNKSATSPTGITYKFTRVGKSAGTASQNGFLSYANNAQATLKFTLPIDCSEIKVMPSTAGGSVKLTIGGTQIGETITLKADTEESFIIPAEYRAAGTEYTIARASSSPKIAKFTYVEAGQGGSTLTTAVTELSFAAPLKVPQAKNVKGNAEGLTEDITITIDNDAFTAPATITADELISNGFDVTFTGDAAQSYTGTLTLKSGTLTATIALSGFAVAHEGTEADPLTPADVIALNNLNPGPFYIQGTISDKTGDSAVDGVLGEANTPANTNIVLVGEDGKKIGVDLQPGAEQDALNIVSHPENVGKTIIVKGTLEQYFGVPGVKNTEYISGLSTTGIADIVADENAPVEYFNLQGIRVDNPENGLYIRRQGNKVTKVIVK